MCGLLRGGEKLERKFFSGQTCLVFRGLRTHIYKCGQQEEEEERKEDYEEKRGCCNFCCTPPFFAFFTLISTLGSVSFSDKD